MEDESVLERPARVPDATLAYGADPDQVADIRYGGARAAQRPLLAILHGGFWRPRYDRLHVGPMADALAALGWTVASVEYRRVPGSPDATVDDVALALNRLPQLATGHDGRVIAIGHSAGGHLALLAANAPSAPDGIVALAPAADLRLARDLNLGDGAVHAFLGTEPEHRADLDPQLRSAPSATTIIVHGEDDAVVPIAVAESYCARHATVDLVRLPACGHFGLIDPLSAVWPQVVEAIGRVSVR